jgi:predicted MFS family arabinose efflux permease
MTMALVAGTSFLLLVYVGYGEAHKSYEQFHIGKMTAQAKVLVNAIEGFLKRDLPLDQYVGFLPRAERLLSSDATVSAIAVFNRFDHPVFESGNEALGLLSMQDSMLDLSKNSDDVEVRRDETYLQVVLPLENDREIIGSIAISMPHQQISEHVEGKFLPLLPIVISLSMLFALFVATFSGWLSQQRWPVLQSVYAGLFLLIAALVIGNLLSLYTKGTQIKTKALADSLGQRMTEVVGFNLDIAQIPGLDKAFSEYRRLNPDIAAAALVVDDIILIHTDSYMVGRPWESASGHYEYLVDISPIGSEQEVNIAVILPQEIVYWQTVRSIKNFAALFIASAFLASLFLQLAGSVNQRDGPNSRSFQRPSSEKEEIALQLVKPVFYVIMCVEHLSYAFLAGYIDTVIADAGLSSGLTSTIFTVYYLCFAITLVPAGHLAQQFSPKPLMIIGLCLTASSFLLLLTSGVTPLILARAAAGIGQAMLFIGVQSYILNVAAPERKTQGAAIIVYGFQGGMISGMAIGSLLVSYIGPIGVFAVGAVVTVFTLVYAIVLVPGIVCAKPSDAQGLRKSVSTLGHHVLLAARNHRLMQAITLIGIPAKAVLTGVVVFAVPLLMAREGYRQEDIGQLLMVYAAGVVLANEYISRWVDRTGDARLVLVTGAVISGIGLCLIGQLGGSWFDEIAYGGIAEVAVVFAGISLLGIAHGFINAPIVSHVASLELADRIGISALTATYRFLERIGHVAGPLVVGQMFLFFGEQGFILAGIGVAIAVLGGLFLALGPIGGSRSSPKTKQSDRTVGKICGLVGLHLDRSRQAIILTLGPATGPDENDPAQSLLLQHLSNRGKSCAPLEAGQPNVENEEAVKTLTRLLADRREALQLKQFLDDVDRELVNQQSVLVIASAQRPSSIPNEYCRLLEGRPGSSLFVVDDVEHWIDQMRGWLTLLGLDSSLNLRPDQLEELIEDLRDYFNGLSGTAATEAAPIPLVQDSHSGAAPAASPNRRISVDAQ